MAENLPESSSEITRLFPIFKGYNEGDTVFQIRAIGNLTLGKSSEVRKF